MFHILMRKESVRMRATSLQMLKNFFLFDFEFFSEFLRFCECTFEVLVEIRLRYAGERPRSLNPGKALAMGNCPIICLFYDLARALMHDVACEFACAVRMRRNN